MFRMPSDHDRFSKLASGIQSLVTTFGIVVAGTWVLYTFWALGATSKSQAEITELEQRALREPVLTIELRPNVVRETKGVRLISVAATLHNSGKRALEFTSPLLQLSKLALPSREGKGDKCAVTQTARYLTMDNQLENMPQRTLRSGQGRTVAFLVEVPSPGNYLLQLRTTYSGQNIIDGELVPSLDVPIEAIEQTIVEVSGVPKGHS